MYRPLRQRIGPQHRRGFPPQARRSEQWNVDSFWDLDRSTPAQPNRQDRPGPSTAPIRQDQNTPIPMEGGEIDSETDDDPSVLEVPAVNWTRYVRVKSVRYAKMGHAPKLTAREEKNSELEQAVRESEKKIKRFYNC